MKKTCLLIVWFIGYAFIQVAAQPPVIYKPINYDRLENLAALELQRYLYLRIGGLSEIKTYKTPTAIPANSIVIGNR